MSWSKISKERRQAEKIRGMMAKHFEAKLFDILQNAAFDQDELDKIFDNKPTEH